MRTRRLCDEPSSWKLKASRWRSPEASPLAFRRGWKNQRLIFHFLGRKIIYPRQCVEFMQRRHCGGRKLDRGRPRPQREGSDRNQGGNRDGRNDRAHHGRLRFPARDMSIENMSIELRQGSTRHRARPASPVRRTPPRRVPERTCKDGGGTDGDDAGGKASSDERTHGVSPSHKIRPRQPKRHPELDVGEGLGFKVHKSAAECAHQRVEISRLRPFEIDKELPDPG